jgi:hypothetical protein
MAAVFHSSAIARSSIRYVRHVDSHLLHMSEIWWDRVAQCRFEGARLAGAFTCHPSRLRRELGNVALTSHNGGHSSKRTPPARPLSAFCLFTMSR